MLRTRLRLRGFLGCGGRLTGFLAGMLGDLVPIWDGLCLDMISVDVVFEGRSFKWDMNFLYDSVVNSFAIYNI